MTRRALREQRERAEAASSGRGSSSKHPEPEPEPESEPEPEPAGLAELFPGLDFSEPAEHAAEPATLPAAAVSPAAPAASVAPAAAMFRPRNTKRAPRAKAATHPTSRESVPSARRLSPVWPRLSKPVNPRAMLAKLMSFGAMVGVAGMLVATSVPANAFHSGPEQTTQAAEQQTPKTEVQHLGVAKTDAFAADASPRDEYTVVSLAEQLRGKYGPQEFLFTNNPNGTIQWPFATSVPISSGFGARAACSFCSSQHMGVDFVPGAGTPIQAIADGVVSDVVVSGGALGVHVVIDHVINGQNIQSVYGHMKWGSPGVAKGQAVTVGQYVGAVGSTGASTGPHLHLEIHVDGTPVDPFAWLKANAN